MELRFVRRRAPQVVFSGKGFSTTAARHFVRWKPQRRSRVKKHVPIRQGASATNALQPQERFQVQEPVWGPSFFCLSPFGLNFGLFGFAAFRDGQGFPALHDMMK